jgi:hypothetical protein
MRRSRKVSVEKSIVDVAGALEAAFQARSNRKRFLARLNEQARSIRSWDVGASAPAGVSGWRLLK